MQHSINKEVAGILKTSAAAVKACYFIKCSEKPIKAHSISNTRLLLKLSDDGMVMYFDKEASKVGTLIETGRGVASTFGGFCGEHDKIFHPVDNDDYIPGDKRQEFLFAMRAAAKELNTKMTVQNAFAEHLKDDSLGRPSYRHTRLKSI